MAAIDKMYVNSYYEYDDLRRWAIAYYPELLFHFYDITMTYQQWEINRKSYVDKQLETSKREYKKLGAFSSVSEAQYNLKQHYLKMSGYVCPTEQAIEEAKCIINAYHKTANEWEDSYTFPIMNTPLFVDKKLLWICPVPCVRKYLAEHCGYKTKWYHKLFWRGKKYF